MSSSSVHSSRCTSRVRAPFTARMSSSSLIWVATASRFCVFWMRNTIRNVTIVVPVLMISCQLSE